MFLICLAGGVGASARYLVDMQVKKVSRHSPVPVGLVVVNVTACLLMGYLFGAVSGVGANSGWLQILGVGFLGGYSTFGSAMAESFQLLRLGRVRLALMHAIGMVAVSWCALAVGLWLASA